MLNLTVEIHSKNIFYFPTMGCVWRLQQGAYIQKSIKAKTSVIKRGIKKGVPINRRVTFIVSLDSKTDIRVHCRKNRKEIASNI